MTSDMVERSLLRRHKCAIEEGALTLRTEYVLQPDQIRRLAAFGEGSGLKIGADGHLGDHVGVLVRDVRETSVVEGQGKRVGNRSLEIALVGAAWNRQNPIYKRIGMAAVYSDAETSAHY